MFPNMRTPAVVVVLVIGLGACGDTAAPHGANLRPEQFGVGACGRGETQLRCWGSLGILTGGTSTSTPVQPGAPINDLALGAHESVRRMPACGHRCLGGPFLLGTRWRRTTGQ